MSDKALIIAVYGEPGTGKTPLAHTAPAPRLVLDAESGSRFVRPAIGKVRWRPAVEPVPAGAGEDWDTCVVAIQSWADLEAAMRVLRSGAHPFVSVILDSLTEIQKKCKDALEEAAGRKMTEALWGDLLSKMENVVRGTRDLVDHPTNPLDCVVLLALEDDRGKLARPLIQGSLQRSLPGFPDVVARIYAYTETDGSRATALQLQGDETVVAKDRTTSLPNGGLSGIYGDPMAAPVDLTEVIERIYEEN